VKTNEKTNNQTEVLSVKNLSCIPISSGVRVVDNVSFSIQKGESVGLLGESGVGKTTLFRSILQLLPGNEWKTEGEISIDGISVLGLSPKELEQVRGRKVRTIFQEPGQSLNPSLKVDYQLIEAVKTINPELKEDEIWKSVTESLANAGLPDSNLIVGRYPGELSGGQRQRVGIAMSLCRQCSILLADEPSNSLDSVTVTELIDTLKNLRSTGFLGSIFCVTHDLSVLNALETERVLFMHAGKLYEAGSIKEVFKNPCHEKLEELVRLSEVVDRHGGSNVESETRASQNTLVSFDSVDFGFQRKSFLSGKKSLVLREINFDVKEGEFVALVGSSGSGKSTIGGVLSRLFSDFSGTIDFDGLTIDKLRNRKDRVRFHRSLQVVFQDPADTFDPSLTMRQNLEECFLGMGMNPDEIEQALTSMLDLLLLDERTLGEFPTNLSGGQKQRYALLRAFGSRPSMIVADEPFTHLDLIAQNRMIEYLKERKYDQDNPMSCILISHEIGIVSKLCDRIIVIDDGRVVENDTVFNILNHAKHKATNRLIDAANKLGTLEDLGAQPS
jgi:peptide/nickel transport system ATP-binding protein